MNWICVMGGGPGRFWRSLRRDEQDKLSGRQGWT
jgi:hypothetical protein